MSERKVEEALAIEEGAGPAAVLWIGGAWSLFQLWIASPLPFVFGFGIVLGVEARAVHLAFALTLAFLLFRVHRGRPSARPSPADLVLMALAAASALYIFVAYDGIVARTGILWSPMLFGIGVAVEFVIGLAGLVLLLEAARRSVGLPLVVIATVFLLYSLFGQSMPDIVSHRGMSLDRLIGYQWFGGEAVFGIPLDVSTSFVFLFVLFGALLDRAGAGAYFLDLAFAVVGKFRGGPAKAAILASGLTGMISGSSIANTVTTGTFTIPIMRQSGMTAVKAGAIEVAASVNGQIMPPIMGAAAFIMAEFIGISYYDVIYHAFVPALITYLSLFYISHLEALKLNLRPMPAARIPPLGPTLRRGIHHFLPIVVLIYLLMVERMTASTSVFYAIVVLGAIILLARLAEGRKLGRAHAASLWCGLVDLGHGLARGGRNMASVAVAIGAAGIIVGAVASTGLNNALIGVVEAIAGSNIYVLLALTAVLCLVLGMGLPTTANYLVVASLMAPVLVELGGAAGLVLPLIVVHLYVFYFGLMADVTPPVGLAAYAAAAISRADPIRTGIQAFYYEIRTAILPVVFVFNTPLVLIGVESWGEGIAVFVTSLVAIFAFASVTQRWLLVRLSWTEVAALSLACAMLFRPDAFLDQVVPRWAAEPLVAGELVADPARGQALRLKITRRTDYGPRYKMFVFTPEEIAAAEGRLGVTLAEDATGFKVADLAFGGAAEQKRIDYADRVTSIEQATEGRPSRFWVSALALALVALVLMRQRTKARRANDQPRPPRSDEPDTAHRVRTD